MQLLLTATRGLRAEARRAGRTKRRGNGDVENAVSAYSHLWAYLCQKRYASANVVRGLARLGRDPMLDEITVLLGERAGLRRIEACRLRICDCKFDEDLLRVWGTTR